MQTQSKKVILNSANYFLEGDKKMAHTNGMKLKTQMEFLVDAWSIQWSAHQLQ